MSCDVPLWTYAGDANIHVESLDVSGRDDAYHDLLAELWASGDDFAIVEHDIEIHGGVLPAFRDCPEPWCVFPYPGRPYKHYPIPILRCALGCTRFRKELTVSLPNIVADLPDRHWRRQDSLLATYLHQAGHTAHVHEPQVIHHHDYAAEPEVAPTMPYERHPLPWA